MISKKLVSLLELGILLISIVSFSFLMSTDTPLIFKNPRESKVIQFLVKPIFPLVSANDFIPSGCCLETNSGAICQEVSLSDSSACKTSLIGTSCNTVEECKTGCCYDSASGICSLNAPKQKCEVNGGQWNLDQKCNIPECQMGCCVLGDSVSMSSNRECTVLSNQYNFKKDFRSLDSQGSCITYNGLTQEGACLTLTNDYSNDKNCVLTTKEKCGGEFKKGYLCTSEELNTVCEKTEKTSCIADKDQVYFLDSCGNRANIYDASKVKNQSYWEKIISSEGSCAAGSSNCGNCDYSTGSICKKYELGKDSKPQYGNNVCRNLNCANGKEHGESWCVSDYNAAGIADSPVGSRNYVAKCMENEITLEACADFNQEVCIQSDGTSYSEARCIINDWRACVEANNKDSYEEVKTNCDQNSQCVMFLEIPGNEKYLNLPGFRDSGSNEDQGKAGDVGKETNKVLAHCVPKYTPGFQFWTTPSNPFSTSKGGTESTNNYGGSREETNALCSLGSFTCVSHQTMDKSIIGGTSGKTDKENPECNIDAFDQSKQKVSLLMEALNERCRSLGSCGSQVNLLGSLGATEGFSITRIKINVNGKLKGNQSMEGYSLSEDYLSSLSSKQTSVSLGSLKKLNDLTSVAFGGTPIEFLFLSFLTGKVAQSFDQTSQEAQLEVGSVESDYSTTIDLTAGIAGGVGSLSLLGAGGGVQTISTLSVASGGAPVTINPGTTYFATTPSTVTFPNGLNYPIGPGTTVPSVTPTVGGGPVQITQGSGNVITPGSRLGGAISSLAITAAAMVLAYAIGKLILKKSNMSPAEGKNFMSAMMAGGAVVGSVAGAMYAGYSAASAASAASVAAGGTATATGFGAGAGSGLMSTATAGASSAAGFSFLALFGAIMFYAAIAYFVYTLFDKSTDHQYYILQYTCEAWEPPKVGDCNVCNSDVRPCSEYKCRSLGNNCHYFVDNGEPGYCASLSEIWKASIKPWPEIVSSNDKYTNIQEMSFEIQDKFKEEVQAWTPVTFGIITDKQAICKIALNHSGTFDEMSTVMVSVMDPETGKLDGLHHQITLSPHVTTQDYEEDLNSATTLPIESGENEYYIKCKNFAGQENEAAFIVKIKMAEGPDLTPPVVTRYSPLDNSYLKFGATNFSFFVYLNEPAECSYSVAYDSNYYSEMPYNMTCLTDPSSGFYGEWPCFASLNNLTEKVNQIFIKCKDQPSLVETDLIKRVETPRSFVYNINKCTTGLSVSILNPLANSTIEGRNSATFELVASTRGCINGGEAFCSFRVDNLGNVTSTFFVTNSTSHSQTISGLSSGEHSIFVSCEDSAGNLATATSNFKINYDTRAPVISRVFLSGKDLVLKTNEPAECIYQYFTNETGNCDFNFENARNQTTQTHTLYDAPKGDYYIRCRDSKLNEPVGCTEVISVK